MIGSLLAGTDESPGEAFLFQGPLVQGLSRHGLDHRDGARLRRPLFPAGHKGRAENSFPKASKGRCRTRGLSAPFCISLPAAFARRHGICRCAEHRGIPAAGAIRAHLKRRAAGKPRPRRDNLCAKAQIIRWAAVEFGAIAPEVLKQRLLGPGVQDDCSGQFCCRCFCKCFWPFFCYSNSARRRSAAYKSGGLNGRRGAARQGCLAHGRHPERQCVPESVRDSRFCSTRSSLSRYSRVRRICCSSSCHGFSS